MDNFKSDIVAELRRVKYKDLQDLVYRMELTYDEILDILDEKCIAGSTIGYTMPAKVYEISDFILMLKSVLRNKVKVNITIDDIRLRSNLPSNKTIKFTKKSFLYTKSGFTQPHSGVLSDIIGFFQSFPGTYKIDIPVNVTGVSQIHLKCDCINGSIVSCIGEQIYTVLPAIDHPRL